MAFIILDDNLLRFATYSLFPLEGEVGKVYLNESNFKSYVWDSLDDTYKFFQKLDKTTITSADQATETERGIAEIATQAETDAGTDDERFITPLKLANYSGFPSAAPIDLTTQNVILPAIPNGVWTVSNLGPGFENAVVFIHSVSSTNQQRTVGVRSVGGGIEVCNMRLQNSVGFWVKTNASSEIELFQSGGSITFIHRKTLVN